jgi:hypothetical protein
LHCALEIPSQEEHLVGDAVCIFDRIIQNNNRATPSIEPFGHDEERERERDSQIDREREGGRKRKGQMRAPGRRIFPVVASISICWCQFS